ncbi:unnamed protein product [Nippostrongylus brasiliensis]|uniref:LRRCT domain-containing protein n=1 Tax=Nippostrongylus brasiliensis TaxID=27835 RepID=A0A0N4YE94_NIPBR|nr:unnamed protein product [Nippostrongylus brasiliensis]
MMLHVLLLLASLFLPSDLCPSVCHCSAHGRTDCSDRGLTEVPTDIPPSTTVLNLRRNHLRSIPKGIDDLKMHKLDLRLNLISSLTASDVAALSQTRIVDLSRNFIKEWPKLKEKIGGNVTSLIEKLDLASNLLSTLHSGIFNSLVSLRSLRLSRNKIKTVESHAFRGLGSLESIDISKNLIRALPSLAFHNLRSLRNLTLAKNEIFRLEDGVFFGCDSLAVLNMSRNHIRTVSDGWLFGLAGLQKLLLSATSLHATIDPSCDRDSFPPSAELSHGPDAGTDTLFSYFQARQGDLGHNHIASFDANTWKQCSDLRWLSLHRNQLQFLPSGAFRLLGRLKYLRLSGNGIESFHKTAMTGLENLNDAKTEIRDQRAGVQLGFVAGLSHLAMEQGLGDLDGIERFFDLHPNLISYENLIRLDLSSNSLAVWLEDNAMLYNTTMPFLKALKFSDNQLRVIPSRTFERFPALESLDLTDNPITTIHRGAFTPLHLRELHLDTSALLCDCHLAWFSSWFVSSRLSRRTVHTRCAHPIPLSGIDVFAIDSNNLTCVDDSPRARIFEHPPASVTTLVGGQARFTCTGFGHAPLHVEWRVIENGRPRTLVPDSTTIMNVNHSAKINETINGQELANAELVLLDVSLDDRAEYQCVIRNRFAAEHSIRSIYQVPVFTNEPDDMSLLVGQNAKIMCAATGIPPPVIKWSKDGGATFPAALQHRLFVRPNDDHLYVVNVTVEDQGVYTCHAVNDAGAIQASATLRIFENSFNVTLKDTVICVNETLLLDCYADLAHPSQRMEWTINGEPLFVDGERVSLKAHGQILAVKKASFEHCYDAIIFLTSVNLTFCNAQQCSIKTSDAGEYACELWAGNDQLARQAATVMVIGREEVKTDQESQQKFFFQPGVALLGLGCIAVS